MRPLRTESGMCLMVSFSVLDSVLVVILEPEFDTGVEAGLSDVIEEVKDKMNEYFLEESAD